MQPPESEYPNQESNADPYPVYGGLSPPAQVQTYSSRISTAVDREAFEAIKAQLSRLATRQDGVEGKVKVNEEAIKEQKTMHENT